MNCFHCDAKFKLFKSAQTHMTNCHGEKINLPIQRPQKRAHHMTLSKAQTEPPINKKDNCPQQSGYEAKQMCTQKRDHFLVDAVPVQMGSGTWSQDRVCEKELESAWRKELESQGHATCIYPNCKLSYLTISGIILHNISCPGHIRYSGWVCLVRGNSI